MVLKLDKAFILSFLRTFHALKSSLSSSSLLKAFSKSLFLGVKDDRDVDQGWYVRTVSLLYGICSGIYSNLLMLSIALLGVLGERLGRSQEVAAISAMEAAVSSADMISFGFRCSSMQFKRRDRYGGPGLLRELFGISDACDM